MTEHEASYLGPEDRRRMVLTEHDLEAIKRVVRACPHGMTAKDVFRLRSFLDTWDRIQMNVGGMVIKVILALVLGIGALLAWISKGGGQG